MINLDNLNKALELARYAPSPDNLQPWSVKFIPEKDIGVLNITYHGNYLTAQAGIYDPEGITGVMAFQMFIEALRIAGTAYDLVITPSPGLDPETIKPDESTTFTYKVEEDKNVCPDNLAHYIKTRQTCRYDMVDTPIPLNIQRILEMEIESKLEVVWVNPDDILPLCMEVGYQRSKLKECWKVHRRILDFKNNFPKWGIPAKSLQMNNLMLWFTKLSLKYYWINKLVNIFGGNFIQAIILENLSCGNVFIIKPKDGNNPFGWYNGDLIYRFWLKATSFNYYIHPSFSPLLLKEYNSIIEKTYNTIIRKYCGESYPIFMGRIGSVDSKTAEKLKQARANRQDLKI
jgi:hypothetical protein